MREFIRPAAAALSIACLAASIAAISTDGALAQAKQQMAPGPPRRAAAGREADGADRQADRGRAGGAEGHGRDHRQAAGERQAGSQGDRAARGVAKKNGFASYDEYNNVIDNISLVLGGFDPATKKYVGSEAVIKAQIAQVQADKKMSAKDKKEALDDLNQALKAPEPPVENKGNIDLVAQILRQARRALGDDQQ